MNTSTRGIKCQFADTDCHTPGTLVTDTKNGFTVRDNNKPDVVEERTAAYNILHLSFVIRCNPQAPATTKFVTEALRRLTHGRRIDDRHQLLQIGAKHRKE